VREYKYIVPLTGSHSAARELLGGKGYNLERLMHANFHVPGGFVVTPRAFRLIVRAVIRDGLQDGGGGVEGFADSIRRAAVASDLESEILEAARCLRTITGPALVVRSSATAEDQESSSMAGQAASFVNVVSDEQLLDAIKRCWASMFTREGVVYRSCHAGSVPFPEMAVVVQKLVPAFRAGVLFTVNPVTGDTGQYIVSASWGLGETVVSGRAADTVYIDRETGRITRQEIARKRERLVPDEGGGTSRIPVPSEMVGREVVDESFARRLWELARKVEDLFQGPQDLEWAEWEGRVYLLQTRPVTTAGKGLRRSVWSSTNVGEALPGVATPFTWSIIRSFSRKGILHAFKGLGCTVPEHYTIVGSIRGRVYLNLSEFISVVSQVPFITPDMLQQLAGGGGAEELSGTYTRVPRFGFLARFPVKAIQTLLARAVTPARVALWSQKFKRFSNEFAETDLASLSSDELVELWNRTNRVFDQTGTLMLECSGQFLMSYLVISLILKVVLGAGAGQAERSLFSGLSRVRSAEPGLDLLRMARQVSNVPGLAEKVTGTAPGELPDALRSGSPEEKSLLSAIEAFLSSHGHRAVREAELSEPRWDEDPSFPLSMLARYLLSDGLPDPEEMIRQRIAQREKTTARVLKMIPAPFRMLFSHLLRETQEAARVREDMRNSVVFTIGFYRTLALEGGRRMAAAGLLHEEGDVFFLAADELLSWLSAEEDGNRLQVMAAMRKLEYEALCSLPDLPPWFVMEGDRIVSPQARVLSGLTLAGLPGSSGVATGRVAVLRSPSEQDKIKPGDVLVAPFTDVGWTPLFLVASAVVTELGGPLSHSCVVAREYGVPAVVNVKDATTILKDGEMVSVDGDSGVVTVQR